MCKYKRTVMFRRLTAMLIAAVMVLSVVLPVYAEELNYIISIENAEDFQAIMEQPDRSYILKNSIDLGMITPLGYNQETGRIQAFSGTLDGNGHTVSFQMKETTGCTNYGLFAELNNAEIASLHVNGSIDVTLSDSDSNYIGILAGKAIGSVGGGSISGEINVTANDSGAIVGGVTGYGGAPYSGTYMYVNNVRVAVDTTIKANGTKYCSYNAVGSYTKPLSAIVAGSADLEGNISAAEVLSDGENSIAEQDVTIHAGKNMNFTAISGGVENRYFGKCTIQVGGEFGNSTARGISGGTSNAYEGDLQIVNDGQVSITAQMAKGCLGAEVNGNLITHGKGYTYGMYDCEMSTMNGNITATDVDKVYGLSECTNAILNGNITYNNKYPRSRLYGAYKGNKNQINGALSIASTDENAGVYGLIECNNSSFSGSLYAKGPESAHAIGACNAKYNVVTADIRVDSTLRGSATGVSSPYSSFEGSISCPGGGVTGCDDNSIAKGNLRGTSVTATGANSYFEGSLEAAYTGGDNQASVSIGCAAKASVSVQGGKNGASFHAGSYFSGSANVSAQDGHIHVDALKGNSVNVNHAASGVSGTVQSMIEKGGREDDSVEVYWHRYAKERNCTNSGHEYIEYGYHSYYKNCYQTVLGAGEREAPYMDLSELGWDGIMNPVLGTYEPEKEPANYIIKVVDSTKKALENYRISIGGVYHYPDTDGSIVIENGPAVISPLTVELKGPGGIYTKVLTRTAYFPIPDMVNVIQLEVDMGDLEILLVEHGYSGAESGKTWGGIDVEMCGKTTHLVQNPMVIDIGEEDSLFNYSLERMSNGHMGYTIGIGIKDLEDKAPGFLKNNPKFIDTLLNNLSKKINGRWGFEKKLGVLAGVDFNISGLGYAELALDSSTNTWRPVDGNLGLVIGGGRRMTYHFPQTGYLIYLTGAYDFEGSGKLGLKKVAMSDSVEHVKVNPYGNLALTGGTELAIGAGNRYLELYAEGGGRGELGGSWELPHKTAEESLALDLTLNGFFRWKVFEWAEQTFESKGLTFPLWPQNNTDQALSMEELAMGVISTEALSMDEDTEYTVLSREYLNANKMKRSVEDASVVSIYPYAQTQLLQLEDGRYVLVYTDDDVARDDADRSALCMRIGTDADGEIQWNDAVTIENDGTGDYGFTACASGNEVAVIWQDMTRTFGDGKDVDMDVVASSVELTQAIVDCNGEIPSVDKLAAINTGTELCERMPMIYYGGGDHVRSIWVTCTDNNPAQISENARFSIWLSEGFGEDGELVKDEMSVVTGMALLPNDLLWSTYVGEGSDLWLRDSAGTVTCQRESGVTNLQSIGSRYIFTKDIALYGGNGNFDSCSQEGYSEVNQNVLRLGAAGDIYYAESGLESSRIYLLDGEIGRPIAEYEGHVSSWDAAGEQIVTVLRTGFTDEDTASMTSQTKQVLEKMEMEVQCDNVIAALGSQIYMDINIFNDGTYMIEEIPVNVTASDGTVLYEAVHRLNLETGESTVVEISFEIPDDFTPQEVTVCAGQDSQTLHLGTSNLALSASWSSGKANGVSVMLKNTGYGDSSGTVEVLDADGNVITSTEAAVPYGKTEILWMDFGQYYTAETEVTVILHENDELANQEDNQTILTIYPVEARSYLVESDLHLKKGEVKTIEIKSFPAGSIPKDMEYRSQNSGIASVDQSGNVRGNSVGEIIILVKDSYGNEYTVSVHVGEQDGGSSGDNTGENPFVDIPETKYYYEPVLWAYYGKITSGTDDTHFSPDGFCTRSQAVTFLWRMAGMPTAEHSGQGFPDVADGKFYTEAVAWAVEQGITSGYTNGYFAPNDTCTRAQIVTFLWRYMGCPEPENSHCTFKDVREGSYYYKPVLWALERGITSGYNEEVFAPSETCTRAQIVTFLYRCVNN